MIFSFLFAVPSEAEWNYWDLLFACHKSEIKVKYLEKRLWIIAQ